MSDASEQPRTANNVSDEHSKTKALERLKFRLALTLTITEKLLIAVIVAIAGFLLNRALETYKADLQGQVMRQKAGYDAQLESLKQQNAEAM